MLELFFNVISVLLENKWTVGLSVLVLYTTWRYLSVPKNLPPGPIAWPIVGSLTQLTEPVRIHLDWDRLRKQYGDVFTLSFGNRHTIVVNGTAIKETLTKAEYSDKPQNTYMLHYMEIEDLPLFLPYSEKWVEIKKGLASGLRRSGWGTPKSEEKVINQIELLLDILHQSDGKPMLIEDKLTIPMTTNVSLDIFISEPYKWDDPKFNEFLKQIQMFYDSLNYAFFADFASTLFPWWLLDLILYSKKKSSRMSHKRAVQFFAEVVDQRKLTFDENNLRDFTDEYILLQKKNGIPDREIHESLMLLTLDSIFNLPAILSWGFYYLAGNPEVQEKAKLYLKQVCGSRKVRLSDRSQLPYIDAIVREILRMSNTSAVSMEHTVTKDMTFRGYSIPKSNNVRVMANLYSLHMNEEFHSEHTKFNPDRFIDSDGSLKKNEAVYPFSLGLRSCMGEQMMKTEMWLFFANVLNEFSFLPPEGEKMNSVDDYVGKLAASPKPFNLCFKAY